MKLHIEHAGNGQTIIASETVPVAYMAPDLPDGVEEMLAAAFAAAPAFLAENAELKEEIDRGSRRRKHTQEWYAEHYGKLHDWARKVLPEPFRNQFFSCIANGVYGHDDVGKPYKCVAGFMVTPSGYFKMETAQWQILFDQCVRAEDAEAEQDALKAQVAILSKSTTFQNGAHGVTNLRGPLVLRHGDACEGCRKVAESVLKAQGFHKG